MIYSQELDPGIDETVDVQRYSNDFPVNLNSVNKNQLALCKCLKESQTNAILEHISTYGGFISWYELDAIPELEPPVVQCLSQYFYVPNIPLTDPPPSPAVDKTDVTLLMQTRWRLSLIHI